MLRYCAGFEYDTALSEWAGTFGSVVGTTTGGRFGGRCLFISQSDYLATTVADGGAASQTWVIGFAFKVTTIGGPNTVIAALIDPGGGCHVSLCMNSSDRKLYAYRGLGGLSGGTLLLSGTTALTSGTWYYIEMKAKIDDTTGTVEVRINGLAEMSGTGLDTRNGGSAGADRVRFGGDGFNSGLGAVYDDFYALDTSGSYNNDFLGDIRVAALYPSGNGTTSNLVGSDGNSVNNYLLVNEASADGDTSYVQSATLNDKDTYAMDDLSMATGTVYAVKPVLTAEKDDAGARSIASVVRLSGTEELSADRALAASYQHLWDIRETKPGGGAWSISDVNSAEIGMKVTV